MKQRVYEQPTTQIIRLETVPLLVSNPRVGVQDYEVGEEQDW